MYLLEASFWLPETLGVLGDGITIPLTLTTNRIVEPTVR
jgi:hypothetical protein